MSSSIHEKEIQEAIKEHSPIFQKHNGGLVNLIASDLGISP